MTFYADIKGDLTWQDGSNVGPVGYIQDYLIAPPRTSNKVRYRPVPWDFFAFAADGTLKPFRAGDYLFQTEVNGPIYGVAKVDLEKRWDVTAATVGNL